MSPITLNLSIHQSSLSYIHIDSSLVSRLFLLLVHLRPGVLEHVGAGILELVVVRSVDLLLVDERLVPSRQSRRLLLLNQRLGDPGLLGKESSQLVEAVHTQSVHSLDMSTGRTSVEVSQGLEGLCVGEKSLSFLAVRDLLFGHRVHNAMVAVLLMLMLFQIHLSGGGLEIQVSLGSSKKPS